MIRIVPALASIAACAFLLSACTGDQGRYPSLARRDAERIGGLLAAPQGDSQTPPPATEPADPSLAARLDRLVAQASTAHARFREKAGHYGTPIRAASRAPIGSEGWASATIALAELESARSETMLPLADLDSLFVAAQTEGTPAAQIAAARNQVAAMVSEEDAVLAAAR